MSEQEEQNGKKALGISFMVLGMSLGVTFGVTLGWAFAPLGISFVALGLIFMAKAKETEQ